MAKKGDLYLIPSLLGGDQIDILSPQIIATSCFIFKCNTIEVNNKI